MSLELKSKPRPVSVRGVRWVGAVLLSINCENGNGLAIEAHPLIFTLSDLIPRCRLRCLGPDSSVKHSQHASSSLVVLRAYGSSAVPFRPPSDHYAAPTLHVFTSSPTLFCLLDCDARPASLHSRRLFPPGPCIRILMDHVAIGLICSSATSQPLLW